MRLEEGEGWGWGCIFELRIVIIIKILEWKTGVEVGGGEGEEGGEGGGIGAEVWRYTSK